jgi:hypothetical protein
VSAEDAAEELETMARKLTAKTTLVCWAQEEDEGLAGAIAALLLARYSITFSAFEEEETNQNTQWLFFRICPLIQLFVSCSK